MSDQETIGLKKALGGNSVMGLFVSLYLILLAFFIVLEVQSETVIAKSEEAIDSVQQTFKPSRTLGEAELSTENAGETAARSHIYLSAVADLFRDELAIEGRFADTSGGLLVFTVPMQTLFLEGSVRLRSDRTEFLSSIGALSALPSPGEHREVSVFFSRGQTEQSGADRLLANRVSEIRSHLVDAGMSPEQFVAGFEPSDVGTVTVVFRLLSGSQPSSALKPWGAGE